MVMSSLPYRFQFLFFILLFSTNLSAFNLDDERTDPNIYHLRKENGWCGKNPFEGLDDKDCVKILPAYFNRNFKCPRMAIKGTKNQSSQKKKIPNTVPRKPPTSMIVPTRKSTCPRRQYPMTPLSPEATS